MRRLALRTVAPLSAGLALAAAAADLRAAADDTPPLAGRWQLDRERSDDAKQKMREAMDRPGTGKFAGLGPIGPGPRSGGPMGGGPMGARPMGGQPAGSRPRGGDPAADGWAGGTMAQLLEPPRMLVITLDDGEVTLDGGGESLLRLRPDGRKVKREGGAVELKARWKDGELVVETEREDGPRMVTSYRVTSDRQELHVTSRVEGPLEDVVVRRVYDAAPPD